MPGKPDLIWDQRMKKHVSPWRCVHEGAQRVCNLHCGYMAMNHLQMASDGGQFREALVCQTSAAGIKPKSTAASHMTLGIAMKSDKENVKDKLGDQSFWNQLTKDFDTCWRTPDHNSASSDLTHLVYLHLWLSVSSTTDLFKLWQKAEPNKQKSPLTSRQKWGSDFWTETGYCFQKTSKLTLGLKLKKTETSGVTLS